MARTELAHRSRQPQKGTAHFHLSYVATAAWLAEQMRRILTMSPEQLHEHLPFLAEYEETLRNYFSAALPPKAVLTQLLGTPPEEGGYLPLQALHQVLMLPVDAVIALLLIGLIEEDARFGQLFRSLNLDSTQHRPTWATIAHLLSADQQQPGGLEPGALCDRLLAERLITVPQTGLPRAEWVPNIPTALWDGLRGSWSPRLPSGWRYTPAAELPDLATLIIPEALSSSLPRLVDLVAQGAVRRVTVRGGRGSNRSEVLAAIAGALGRDLLVARHPDRGEATNPLWELLGPLCTLTGSLPVIEYDLAPGETASLPELAGYRGPVSILLGQDGGVEGSSGDGAVVLELPMPDGALRERYWGEALGGRSEVAPAELSLRFQLPGEYIRQVGAMAITQAALAGRDRVGLTDIRQATRSFQSERLDTLAMRMAASGNWADLAISPQTQRKLDELALRCRLREQLWRHASPVYQAGNRGVRALLSGPSGTGKTLTAKVLAAVLEKEIYRVDLASVISKWIGETEKNLSQLFSRAEELDVILLLDEGDSLLGKRSEVQSSQDRSANMQTNYLLQRLENHQGIVLVTTNLAEQIDKGFQRRFDVVVEFTAPQAEERLRIWALHLPAQHQLSPLDLEEVALRYPLTGGQIRNAALYATLLAMAGEVTMTPDLVREAVREEYRKIGAIAP